MVYNKIVLWDIFHKNVCKKSPNLGKTVFERGGRVTKLALKINDKVMGHT